MRDISAQGNLWQTTCVENVNTSSLDEDLQLELALVGGGITACSAALRATELGAAVCSKRRISATVAQAAMLAWSMLGSGLHPMKFRGL